MERSLVLSALAVGLVCWFVAFGLTRTKRFAFAGIDSALPPVFLILAAGLPVLLFILTVPNHGKFFAPGHDLGNGFLIGALGALLSGALLVQNLLAVPAERSPLRTAAVTACPFGLAVSCAAAPLLIPHDTLYIALLGAAVGWLAVTGILMVGLMQGKRANDPVRAEPITMLAGAGFVTMLCSCVALGDFHGEVTFIKSSTSLAWGVLALTLAGAVPLFLLLSAAADLIFNPDPDFRAKTKADAPRSATKAIRANIGRVVVAVGGVGVLAKILSSRVIESSAETSTAVVTVGPSHLFKVISIGLLVGLLCWWLSYRSQDQEKTIQGTPSTAPWQNSALGILVVLAGTMISYQMLAGFGVGLMLIGMMPAVGLALLAAQPTGVEPGPDLAASQADCAIRVVQLAALGSILALFRVYTTVNEGLFPHSPYTDQYAAFGFVAGIVLPMFLAGYLMPKQIQSGDAGDAFATLGRLLVSGALILAVPSLILALWGQKCIMAFLTASAISAAGIGWSQASDSVANSIRKLFPAIYAVGLSLTLCEWSHYVLDMEDWTRIQKERVIVQIVGAAVLLVLAADFWPRIAARIKSGGGGFTSGTKGGAR